MWISKTPSKNGQWRIQFYFDRQKYIMAFKSQKEQLEYAARIEDELIESKKTGNGTSFINSILSKMNTGLIPEPRKAGNISTITPENAFHNYLELKSKSMSRFTIQTYTSRFLLFRRFIKTNNLNSITPQIINQFKIKLIENEYSPNSINGLLKFLSVFFMFCKDMNYIVQNPFKEDIPIKHIIVPVNPKPYLYPEEIVRLLDASQDNIDMYLFIAFGAYAGLRKGEIFNLKWNNISIKPRKMDIPFVISDNYTEEEQEIIRKWILENMNRTERILTGSISIINTVENRIKNSKSRSVPLSRELLNIILDVQNRINYNSTDYVIYPNNTEWKKHRKARVNNQTLFYSICKKAGLETVNRYGISQKVTAHILRHTFVSLLLERGYSHYKIMEFTGHSALEIQRIYGHISATNQEISFSD